MANYGPPGSQYGAPPGYSNYMGAPNLGPMSSSAGAPGMSPPPGVAAQSPVNGSGPFNPANYQLPPGINPHASVIRLGGPQGGKPGLGAGGRDSMVGNRGRTGLGMDGGRSARDSNLSGLTKDEVQRTIYVGGLSEGMPNDVVLEMILNIGQGLRRWSRVTDADGKPCDFGFAEYDDAEALQVATKLLEDLELPIKNGGESVKAETTNGATNHVKSEDGQQEVQPVKTEDGDEDVKSAAIKNEEGDFQSAKLIVIVDPQSVEYLKQWLTEDKMRNVEFRVDGAQDNLRSLLAQYRQGTLELHQENGVNGDMLMPDFAAQAAEQAELLALPSADDELSDIPADQREMVAAEIAAFRERSNKRDLERLREEEEIERQEREKSRGGSRINRLASPPPVAPKGPGGANGIPVGPRNAGIPTGPKQFKGLQIPKDHVDGIRFVSGDGAEEDDDSASDEELEKRRQKARDEELDKIYLEQERKWLQREKAHFAAVDRQQQDEAREAAKRDQRKQSLAEKLSNFDDEQGDGKRHLFYVDRKAWRSSRRAFRQDERHEDDRDRDRGRRELEHQQRRQAAARGPVDRFQDETTDEVYDRRDRSAAPEKQGFSLNLGFGGLGGTAAKERAEDGEEEAKPVRATMADMENLLDDEDVEAEAAPKLKGPVEFKPLAAGEKMTEEQRAKASGELAKSIPNDAESLFGWQIKWDHLPDRVITDQLRPYVQRKVMEALGVQEEMLVSSIEGIIKRHGSAEDVMRELEETLDEEAEMVTRRVWKMVVFYSESGARGLIA